jgi:hypothetical protein
MHRADHAVDAHEQLHDFVSGLIADGVRAGRIRSDVGANELASYCLHALSAAGTLASKAAVKRLVTITLDGLRPSR